MSAAIAEIIKTEYITPDVKRFVLSKPKGFTYTPGQACMIAMDQEGWRDKQRPFTFSGLPSARTLELIVKMYPDHHGVTEQLGLIHKGASLLLNDVFGTITYKGKGTFFAAGGALRPFWPFFAI